MDGTHLLETWDIHDGIQASGSSGGQENSVWDLVMGREVASVFFLLAPPLTDEDRGCHDGEPKHNQQQEADK